MLSVCRTSALIYLYNNSSPTNNGTKAAAHESSEWRCQSLASIQIVFLVQTTHSEIANNGGYGLDGLNSRSQLLPQLIRHLLNSIRHILWCLSPRRRRLSSKGLVSSRCLLPMTRTPPIPQTTLFAPCIVRKPHQRNKRPVEPPQRTAESDIDLPVPPPVHVELDGRTVQLHCGVEVRTLESTPARQRSSIDKIL